MNNLLIFIEIIFVGFVAWWSGKSLERTQNIARIRELESKARLSQGESSNLKEQLNVLRGEVGALQKSLNEARLAHTSSITQLTHSFKKGLLVLTTVYFSVGLSLGGVFSWQAATWRIEKRNVSQKAEMELNTRLAQVQTQILEKQADELQKNLEASQKAYQEEREQKTIVMTKLQILLSSLSFEKKVKGFVLNNDKLKKNLRSQVEFASSKQEFPVMASSKS